jgi:sulfur carrier protein
MFMNLIINGEELSFDDGKTIFDIMTELKIIDKVMAVAVNMNIVKKEEWSSFIPQENDKIELLQFVGGG